MLAIVQLSLFLDTLFNGLLQASTISGGDITGWQGYGIVSFLFRWFRGFIPHIFKISFTVCHIIGLHFTALLSLLFYTSLQGHLEWFTVVPGCTFYHRCEINIILLSWDPFFLRHVCRGGRESYLRMGRKGCLSSQGE